MKLGAQAWVRRTTQVTNRPSAPRGHRVYGFRGWAFPSPKELKSPLEWSEWLDIKVIFPQGTGSPCSVVLKTMLSLWSAVNMGLGAEPLPDSKSLVLWLETFCRSSPFPLGPCRERGSPETCLRHRTDPMHPQLTHCIWSPSSLWVTGLLHQALAGATDVAPALHRLWFCGLHALPGKTPFPCTSCDSCEWLLGDFEPPYLPWPWSLRLISGEGEGSPASSSGFFLFLSLFH